MRLISLVLALVLVGGLVVYNKNSLFPGGNTDHKTVKQQVHQIMDNAKGTAADLQKQMQEQQKKIQQNTK